MVQFLWLKKLFFVLPLLAAAISLGLNESFRLKTEVVLALFAVALSIVLYLYQGVKNGQTQQDEALSKLEGELAWLKGILEELPLGVVFLSKQGVVNYVNKGFEKITGHGSSLCGMNYKILQENIFPVSERGDHLERVFKLGQPSGEHRRNLLCREGRVIPVQAIITPMPGPDGSPAGVICLFSDHTSRFELHNLQKKTHFFLDYTSSCVLAVDKNLKVTLFNAAAEKVLGLKKEDVLGRHITEIFNDYEAENYPIIKTIVTGEEFRNYEVTLFLNGQIRTLLFDTGRITGESGEVTGAIGIFKDVSESKRIQEELKHTVFAYSKEKSFMRNLLNNLPVAVFTYDHNLLPTYMNRVAENLTGYRSEELVGPVLLPEAAVSLDLHSRFSRHLAKGVLDGGEPVLGEQKTLVSRDGTAIPVSLDIYPLYNALREKNGVMIIARDLREVKKHEQLMYLSRCILNSLNSAVVSIDAECRVIVLNPPAEKLLGLRSEDFTGKIIDDLPCSFFREQRILQDTLESGIGVRFLETTLRTGDEEVNLLINSDVILDREDNILGAVAILQDITELRRTQNAVRERERLAIIGQMAAGMAHEVKNPLTAVRGFSQLLLEKHQEQTNLREYAEIIIEEIDRANNVVTDFLQLARPKKPVLQEQSVGSLIEETVAIVGPQAFLSNIAVQCEIAEDLPPCCLDRDQIKQVLLNMCQNSIEAIPGKGVLKIKAGLWPEGKEIFIEITDDGCGMSPESRERIGVPFYTTKEGGTGLGLSISYSIISAHQGRVEVTSKEGEGTTFRVYLPAGSP